jgi:hypothetical protein
MPVGVGVATTALLFSLSAALPTILPVLSPLSFTSVAAVSQTMSTSSNSAKHLLHMMLVYKQVFVSPWGWGEWSHKDFEAMMCGCLVVKPGPDSYRFGSNLPQTLVAHLLLVSHSRVPTKDHTEASI